MCVCVCVYAYVSRCCAVFSVTSGIVHTLCGEVRADVQQSREQ